MPWAMAMGGSGHSEDELVFSAVHTGGRETDGGRIRRGSRCRSRDGESPSRDVFGFNRFLVFPRLVASSTGSLF